MNSGLLRPYLLGPSTTAACCITILLCHLDDELGLVMVVPPPTSYYRNEHGAIQPSAASLAEQRLGVEDRAMHQFTRESSTSTSMIYPADWLEQGGAERA